MDWEQFGRVERIGKATLINADCMDIMRELPDKAFDLAIVDPPYGIDINSSGRLGHYGGKGKKWDSFKPNNDYFNKIKNISFHQIIWGGNYFQLPPTRGFIIWDKQQPDGVSFASCEYAWSSFEKSAKTFYQKPMNADAFRIHPTQKPVALYGWLLNNYAKPGQTIFDSHGGSFSLAIACNRLGFEFVGVELDADYFDAAVARVKSECATASVFDFGATPQPTNASLLDFEVST